MRKQKLKRLRPLPILTAAPRRWPARVLPCPSFALEMCSLGFDVCSALNSMSAKQNKQFIKSMSKRNCSNPNGKPQIKKEIGKEVD
mmetsp:Transcript_14961/g.29099  ORF Transcript_14961/g.29099 Transcript_14961/m.29099 type:complete len:86 (-) Transcript_14961:229-486(-)